MYALCRLKTWNAVHILLNSLFTGDQIKQIKAWKKSYTSSLYLSVSSDLTRHSLSWRTSLLWPKNSVSCEPMRKPTGLPGKWRIIPHPVRNQTAVRTRMEKAGLMMEPCQLVIFHVLCECFHKWKILIFVAFSLPDSVILLLL